MHRSLRLSLGVQLTFQADPCDKEFGALGVCTHVCGCTRLLSPTAFAWGSLDVPIGFPVKGTSSGPATNNSAPTALLKDAHGCPCEAGATSH